MRLTKAEVDQVASPVRSVLLGYDDAGLTHVPGYPPTSVFNEARCRDTFDRATISVVVKEMPDNTSLTCIECIARHYDKLWTVLTGTLIRV